MLSIPLTIALTQQQQDIRQEASETKTFGQTCTITTSGFDSAGNFVTYNSVFNPPIDNCTYPYRCEPVLGQGSVCVEVVSGSKANGQYCRQHFDCQSGICYYPTNVIGASSCIARNSLQSGQPCYNNNECQSNICYKAVPTFETGVCQSQPSPTPTRTPTPTNSPTPTRTPTPTSSPTPSPTTIPEEPTATTTQGLACDPDASNDVNMGDFNVWRDEYFKLNGVNTTKSACFADDKAIVDIFDFNAWRDIYFKSNQ